MNETYQAPRPNHSLELNFSTLGIWRKIFIIWNWIVTLAISVLFLKAFISVVLESGVNLQGFVRSMILILIFPAYGYWLHTAVSKRKLNQQMILIFLQVIPMLNPIGALILVAIRSTSKKELDLN